VSRAVARAHSDLVVVDGSNIATEGRSTPSLAQLNDAVLSFRDEFPDVKVTVVVDATFGHRIAKSEVAAFDAAVAHNELVAPPAGAVGRGDAFVLGIADKSGARILSNDSFQEFHGKYAWLFDEGRLVGGKPVPHVGWVFVERLPVKGPVSRKARASVDKAPSRRSASKLASEPMPVPTKPPPGPAVPQSMKAVAKASEVVSTVAAATKSTAPRGGPVNELLPFLDFVEHHPIGSSVNGVVESYSSHGAYVTVGDLRGYVPLRLMGDPPPRSAREVMKLGEAVTLVVDSFSPSRRNVDLALPGVVTGLPAVAVAAQPAPTTRTRTKKKAAEPKKTAPKKVAPKQAAPKKAAAKKAAAKKAVQAKKVAEPKKSAAKQTGAPPTTRKQTLNKAVGTPSPQKAERKTANATRVAEAVEAPKITRQRRMKKAVTSSP
jgi:hypothetical protein